MAQHVFPLVRYRDPKAAIAWLADVLGLEQRVLFEQEGRVVHFELAFEGSVVMGSGAQEDDPYPAGPQTVYLSTDRVDELHARAQDRGAEIVSPIADQDYGSRDFAVRDPEGNVWSLGTYAPAL